MDNETTDIASNDRAFIKVAMELRSLENAVLIGETMIRISKRLNAAEGSHRQNYSTSEGYKVIASQCLATGNCPEPFRSYMTFIENAQNDFEHIAPQLEKYRARIAELKALFDSYVEGKDIVMAKLTLNKDQGQESEE